MDSTRGNILVTVLSVTGNEYINMENTKHTRGLDEHCRNHTLLTLKHIQTVTNHNETHISLRVLHCTHLHHEILYFFTIILDVWPLYIILIYPDNLSLEEQKKKLEK
jgi:hypothetical protein